MNLLERYIISLTNLYGVVHQEKVISIYNEQNVEKMELADILNVDFEALQKKFAYKEGNYFIHESVYHFDEMEIELAKKQDKPYYVPPRNVLLKYEDSEYFEKNTHYYALRKYLRKHFSKEVADIDDLCLDLQLMCQLGDGLPAILQRMQQVGIVMQDKEQLQEVAELIINLENNTRIWSNNGFTPRELFEMEEKQHLVEIPSQGKQKIGRNEPCPCGSGKKYKKCCL